MVKTWWVCQNTTINGHIPTEVVWSPHSKPNEADDQWHWKTMWEVKPGDIILHYSNQYITAISTALTTARPASNPYEDGSNSWDISGKRIEVDIHRLDAPIPKSEIPLIARQHAFENHGPFQQTGKRVKQGYFFPVPNELWEAIQNLCFNDIKESVENQDQISFNGSSDIEAVVKGRREQTQLRARLLHGEQTGICGICGRRLPSRYLHAAHIKPRAAATELERHDPNIAMLDCVLGCDEAFECGDIQVDLQGHIMLSEPDNSFLQETFGTLVGKKAPAFNKNTAQYFAAKHDMHSKR
ncbi:hypothetical protein [Bifidobacterium tibiigranuli]|jgi:hypothetical protein|uniref:hypothetical protein n=1 Tax=Bifidobacterium tibiigranuli TaxID=2172043 RepID=UPI0026EB0280|nr:hypothetical protein [Bifidobacterium tibiigranuli]MCI2185060.1 hypothetical protein [Bifidobacterium tibiigranuli]MCI2203375.1 hypothetical protein [Bifidobacterium tibiigranuli]